MCGIVGIHGKQEDAWINIMNREQIHRGPDEDGLFRDREANLSLASRRLAIIDVAQGQQPMSTHDKRYTIVFNGEIFNAPALRKELEKKGVEFFTDHSDTEVVLHLYEQDGPAMTKKLNGMFAFAIFDREKKTIFCARDHMGIKPFYYLSGGKFNGGGHFAFASELKSLLTLPFVKREVNMQSLFHYMSLQYVPGKETIFEGIHRLPAGHNLTYYLTNGKIKIERFWRPEFSQGPRLSASEWAAKIRETLQGAVSRWTLSDVQIACSLSGGLDSSSIVGLLAKSGRKVKTYSLGFSGSGESSWNELPRARAVAKKWSTDHHELVLKPETMLDDLLSMVWHLDEPYGGGLPSWAVFQCMSEEVKVGLTGSGGDELFGNYGKWKFLEKHGKGNVSPEEFRKDFFERFYYFSDEEKKSSAFNDSAQKCKNTSDFLYEYYASTNLENARDRSAFTDIETQLPEEFLMMTDRFSMAHSLEARAPFLDTELVKLALSIPAEIRTKSWNLKYLLRKSTKDVLPFSVAYGRKKGFVIPLTLWLRGPLKKLAAYLLNPERLKKQGMFSPQFYEHFVRPHLEGEKDFTNKVWTALMFQLWHHVFMEEKSLAKPSYTWKDIAL